MSLRNSNEGQEHSSGNPRRLIVGPAPLSSRVISGQGSVDLFRLLSYFGTWEIKLLICVGVSVVGNKMLILFFVYGHI